MFEYNSPIITMMRKGTPDDPHAPYEETLQIGNGKVSLTEIPTRDEKVVVLGEDIMWIETDGELKQDNWFQVDYNLGVVHFKSVHNGKSLTFKYSGKGSQYVPADRVYTKHDNGSVTETLEQIIKQGTGAIESLEEVNIVINKAETAISDATNAANLANEKANLVDTKIISFDNNESIRESNEASRKLNEATREASELSRTDAELTRIANEDSRESNELIRQANEDQRQSDTSTALSNTEAAINEAKTVSQNAQDLIDTSIHLREYSPITNYVVNNEVRYNGSTWRCMQDCKGVVPTEGVNWTLVAQRGVDGTGSVSTVNGKSPDESGNVEITSTELGLITRQEAEDLANQAETNAKNASISISQKGIAGGVAVYNSDGKVIDANGNEVEGKVKSVNGQTGDVVIDVNTTEMAHFDYIIEATQEDQSVFIIPLETFSEKDMVELYINRIPLQVDDFIVSDKTITLLNDTVTLGESLYVKIIKNIQKINQDTLNGSYLSNNTVSKEKLTQDIKDSLTKADNSISSSDIGKTVAGFNESGQVLDKNGNVVGGGSDPSELIKQINSLYRQNTNQDREIAYLKLKQEASERVEGGTVFAHDMRGNIIGMTLDEVNSENIVIRDGKMLMINQSEETKTITDATVVSSAYDTSGNGGRRMVRLSNGWIVACVTDLLVTSSQSIKFYVKKTPNSEFELLTTISTSNYNSYVSIASKETVVTILITMTDSTVVGSFDFTTVESSISMLSKNFKTISNNQLGHSGNSLVVNKEETELHACWASKDPSLPNSFNIHYVKGIISQVDGSVTWSAVEQLSTADVSTQSWTNPSIIVRADGKPSVFVQVRNGAGNYGIYSINYRGSTWSNSVVYIANNIHVPTSPSAIFVPKSVNGLDNGRIWVSWHSNDSASPNGTNIFVSYSDDAGLNFSDPIKLTSDAGFVSNKFVTITANNMNEIFVVYYSNSTGNALVRMRKYSNDSWGAVTNVTNTNIQTADAQPSTLVDISLSFTVPLVIYKTSTKVVFSGTWQETVEEYSLTAKAVYRIPKTDYIGLFVRKSWVTPIFTNLSLFVNGLPMETDNDPTEKVERAYKIQLPVETDVELVIDMSRDSTDAQDANSITRILGGRS
ncbi:exo-alpha-sialidase [Bacillus sp. Bva_UNVM-123]|uniref:sialidase family protein n=1 Tax=Bacillus sp. Bva_UNVM-123 TaxID=2829798 RepID=UPI00391FC425